MAVLLSMVKCPNCGAPHSVSPTRHVVICVYCNTSLIVVQPAVGGSPAPGASSATVVLSAQAVSKEDVERVKQLLIDGKRDEAIAFYARVAAVSREEAERAVEGVVISSYFTVTRELPINALGFALYALLVFAGLGLAAWAATRAMDSPAWFVLVALGILFALARLISFVRHVRSTLVASFGALGRARVLRSAVLRAFEKKGSYLIAIVFEVAPDDGGPPFVDQENLLVGTASLQKLAPGNVVRVRFDRARTRVFPATPVTVLSSAGSSPR